MSAITPRVPAPRSTRRWVVSSLLVTSLATAALLLWNGSASGSVAAPTNSAASPSFHVFGLPIGVAIWLLLGVAGLAIGMTGGRSRGVRPNSLPVSGDPLPTDEPVVLAA